MRLVEEAESDAMDEEIEAHKLNLEKTLELNLAAIDHAVYASKIYFVIGFMIGAAFAGLALVGLTMVGWILWS